MSRLFPRASATQSPQGHAPAPQAPGAARRISAEDAPAEAGALARIALEQFLGRYRKAQEQAAAFGEGWPGDPANESLTLWTAIALAAGVGRDLPREVCAAIEVEALYPRGAKYLPLPSRIAEDHAWKGELARARDVARAKAEGSADQRLIQRAIDLTVLAEALGAPPVTSVASFEGREAA